MVEHCVPTLTEPVDSSDIGYMPDDPTDQAALAREWDDQSGGPARVAPVTQQRFAPSDPSRAGNPVNGWVSDHMVVASVLVLAAVCLIVAAGDAAFGKHGIWVAIEVLAVLVCASGAYLWNRASASGNPAVIARFKRQTLFGAFFVVLIAIRIATKAY